MTTPELEDLRTKLIQTAAVCVAIVEDIDSGVAYAQDDPRLMRQILREIDDERYIQDKKWGPQHHRIADWLSILGEEFGEACKAYNDNLLTPTVVEQKRIGLELSSVPDVQWGKVEPAENWNDRSEAAELMDLGTTITDFVEGGKLTRTRVPDDVLADRASRRMRGELLDPLVFETDVEPHDDLEGLFDRLREEVNGD